MKEGNESELKVAEFLLKIKAVQLNPENPFTWASGWKSPIYCDNRKILSHHSIRTYVRQEMVKKIEAEFSQPDCIAGVATGGIPLGVLVAQELGLPFVYIRSKAKEHGAKKRIEGEIHEGAKVIVIEDLISTGNSSLSAVEALRDENVDVRGLVAVFDYGFELAKKNFKAHECKYFSLCNYETLIHQAIETNYIRPEQKETLMEWRMSPDNWKGK
ncbi:orotate phosphoribosyltransferase [Luteibaculum oceani]|uniref:Orotate phosphoribosyltransferase n=1 Tax=Luteibaculum oceani TaxID=1294296 RepID=A0A5C6V9A4_9FLAO|nr:orotate phosphoribosyltransferase [Luteibaculum oceani]TXC81749.1 orotate phosphoribosyltransferase [Luteibaculum oceani]